VRERLDKRAEEASSKFVGLLPNFQAKRPYPDRTLESQPFWHRRSNIPKGWNLSGQVTGENNGLLLLFSPVFMITTTKNNINGG